MSTDWLSMTNTEFKDNYNMVFKKTREGEGSGIIALTSNGTEVRPSTSLTSYSRALIGLRTLRQSVGDVCRLLLKWSKFPLREDYGFGGDNPC